MSEHSMHAIRRAGLRERAWFLAWKRVQRGRMFLIKNAPVGWHRNLFEPLPCGRSFFRCKDSHGHECVLALAFEHRQDLANDEGYVTFASVSRSLGISGRERLLGFCSDEKRGVTSQMLDMLWEQEIREASWISLPVQHEREATRHRRLFRRFLPDSQTGTLWPATAID